MRYYNVLVWLSKPKKLWAIIFLYTIVMGLFVQLIFLPRIVPSWHAGNGLLKGIDGPGFHRIALRLSEAIKQEGWQKWELTPDGQLVSGIAAIFYVLIYPAPWSVLPLNAFLNASACVCFYLLLAGLARDRLIGLVSALPFMFFPSALLWNTQFHNENYAVPGVIFILYGWMCVLAGKAKLKTELVSQNVVAVVAIIFGSLLLGLVRDYILSGMLLLFVIAVCGLIIFWILTWLITGIYTGKIFLASMACVVMLMTGYILKSIDMLQKDSYEKSSITIKNVSDDGINTSPEWNSSAWLPLAVDSQLKHLAKYRNKFVRLWSHGGSSIDLDVSFDNVDSMILYIPRSFQIVFFSPFPNTWFSEGKKAAGSGMRVVSAVETLVAYICFSMLPVFIWNHRKQPIVFFIFFVCVAMLTVYAMIVPNIGALYRFRYPYYMPLVCLGLAGWLEVLLKFKNRQTS